MSEIINGDYPVTNLPNKTDIQDIKKEIINNPASKTIKIVNDVKQEAKNYESTANEFLESFENLPKNISKQGKEYLQNEAEELKKSAENSLGWTFDMNTKSLKPNNKNESKWNGEIGFESKSAEMSYNDDKLGFMAKLNSDNPELAFSSQKLNANYSKENGFNGQFKNDFVETYFNQKSNEYGVKLSHNNVNLFAQNNSFGGGANLFGNDVNIVMNDNSKKINFSNDHAALELENTASSQKGTFKSHGFEVQHLKDKNNGNSETTLGIGNFKLNQKNNDEKSTYSAGYENNHGTKIEIGKDEQGRNYEQIEADIMKGVKGGVEMRDGNSKLFIKGELHF